MLRINPDDACQIQILNCTTGNWDLWTDPSDCARAVVRSKSGQQTDTTPIAADECRTYDIVMATNQQYLLPVQLSTGDTITVTDLDGAANDGVLVLGVGAWNIPNGGIYRGPFGNEPDNTSFISGDTLETAPHMSLIMNVGGEWYTAFDADGFVVPGGVTQENIVFMVNDSNILDNSGDYKFQVEICKHTTVTPPPEGSWVRVYDFRTGSHWGWREPADPDNNAVFNTNGWYFNFNDAYTLSPDMTGLSCSIDSIETFWSTFNAESTVQIGATPSGFVAQAASVAFVFSPSVDVDVISVQTEWGPSHYPAFLYKVIVYGHGDPMPDGVNPF